MTVKIDTRYTTFELYCNKNYVSILFSVLYFCSFWVLRFRRCCGCNCASVGLKITKYLVAVSPASVYIHNICSTWMAYVDRLITLGDLVLMVILDVAVHLMTFYCHYLYDAD